MPDASQSLTDAPLRPPLLTQSETAQVLGLGLTTVQGLIRRRQLAAVRVGRSTRVDPRDVEAFIASRKTQAVQPAGAAYGRRTRGAAREQAIA